MQKFAVIVFAFLLAFAAPASLAHLENDNPRASIAFVGEHAFFGPVGSELPQRFKVRVVDSHGSPLRGLKVWFFPNAIVTCCGATEPPPPASQYGAFQGIENPLGILTDANGVATAPPFRIGVVPHDVAAGIYTVGGPENAVVGWPPLVAYFHVNHVVTEPPVTGGGVQPVALPTTSLPGLAGLVLATALAAFVAMHRRRRQRQR